jgi:hypothetical protein
VEGEGDEVEEEVVSELPLPAELPFFSSLEPPVFSSLSAFFRDSEG